MLRALPNLVTASRGLCGPVVLVLLIGTDQPWAAFWVFAVAMWTDLFDGWLASKLGSDRELGALLDPLADKTLATCAWIGLWARGWAPTWLVGPLILRDVLVAVGWRVVRSRGITWRPSKLGQLATSYEGSALGILMFHGPWLDVDWPVVGATVGLCALACSVGSALGYLVTGPPPHAAPPTDATR